MLQTQKQHKITNVHTTAP